MHAQLCPTLSTPWVTVACQALLSMEFSRQEYWAEQRHLKFLRKLLSGKAWLALTKTAFSIFPGSQVWSCDHFEPMEVSEGAALFSCQAWPM